MEAGASSRPATTRPPTSRSASSSRRASSRRPTARAWPRAAGTSSLIEKAITKAKRTHDYVIVSFHWGVEYKDNANAEQVKVAHRCGRRRRRHGALATTRTSSRGSRSTRSASSPTRSATSSSTTTRARPASRSSLNAEMGPNGVAEHQGHADLPRRLRPPGGRARRRGRGDPQAAQEDLEAARHHRRHPRRHCEREAMRPLAPQRSTPRRDPALAHHPHQRGPLPGRHAAAAPRRPAGALPRRRRQPSPSGA